MSYESYAFGFPSTPQVTHQTLLFVFPAAGEGKSNCTALLCNQKLYFDLNTKDVQVDWCHTHVWVTLDSFSDEMLRFPG